MVTEQLVITKRIQRTRLWWLRVALFGAVLTGLYFWLRPQPVPLAQVRTQYIADITALDSASVRLHRALLAGQPIPTLQTAFRQTRLAWKRVEFLAELYNPETAKAINGPAIPEVEEDDGLQSEVQPTGLQVIEEGLFPTNPAGLTPETRTELVEQAAILHSVVGRLHRVSVDNTMTDSHVFDAMRLEVFRLIAMGITGFDAPIANTSLPETAEALGSLQRHLSFYSLPDHQANLAGQLDQLFAGAIAYLNQPGTFNNFDRLTFIRKHGNTLSGGLLDAQKALLIPVFQETRFLSSFARTLSDSAVFDPSYFVNANNHRATPERVALGKMLFYDPILSGNAERTCATCHQPDRAFTDGEPKSLAVGFGGRRIARNTPTLYNASLQAVQFADSRVTFLEDQAGDVIQNAEEMHGSLPKAVVALKIDPAYKLAFAKTFPDGVTELNLKNAIASYVRSLISLDSRVDRAIRANNDMQQAALLTGEEKHGFNIFMGKGKCATCHFYPLYNGTVPPGYVKTENEVLGTPATAQNKRLDDDLGKFGSTRINLHRHSFKTPTVRFTAKTAPYMHNGAYATLEEVIDFYDKGGGTGLGFDVPNQTLPGDKLNLTVAEKKALAAFMKAL